MSLLLKIDPARPDPGKMAEAVRILKGGGVVAFPTETFYGLGVDARNEEAGMRRLPHLHSHGTGRITPTPTTSRTHPTAA